MPTPQFVTLDELKLLFNPDNTNRKIESIKLLRQITGAGLKETKDFFEQVVVSNVRPNSSSNKGKPITTPDDLGEIVQSVTNLSPPMFLVGMTYLQLDKTPVLIVGVANYGTSYETVYSIGSNGEPIHRYNRRDFGRVTGTDANNSSPYNLKRLDL